jgi:leader peptidase (prepilin peptidase) / N-methyltransferase
MLEWVWLVFAAALGVLAAGWLRTRRYRRADDEVERTLSPWWVPVVSVLAGLGAAPFLTGGPAVVLATYVLALVWAVVLAVVDLEVKRLPDALVLPAYPGAAVLLAICSAATGDGSALLRAAACAGGGVAFFLVAALASPVADGLGLGDVKLAGVLGALLGWLGWYEAVMGLLTGFVIGGLVAMLLLVLRRVRRSGSVPLGPAMLAGAYLWFVLSPLT